MNDRKLLELAAKAAGLESYSNEFGSGPIYRKYRTGLQDWVRWNPLTDDGDAFRLANRLRLRLQMMRIGCGTARVERIEGGWSDYTEPANGDEDSAMRRAIVRAAAEIGRNMK